MTDSTPSITVEETAGGRQEPKKQTGAPTVRRKSDPYIWGIYLSLLVASLIELYSASSTEVSAGSIYSPLVRHAIFLFLGLGIAVCFEKTRYYYFRKFAVVTAIFTLGLVVVSSFFGITINGAQRALSIAGFTIQPAEIAKLSLVLLLAYILARCQEPGGVSNKGCFASAVVVVLFCSLIWANGLTNMVILMAVSVIMFVVSGMQWRKFGIILIVYAVFGFMAYKILYDKDDDAAVPQTEQTVAGGPAARADANAEIGRVSTHEGRLERYIRGVHPTDTIDDTNRQEILARFAQARGGIGGKGPGNSRESVRLPLAFSDYIYSIIVEDTGLVGGVCLMILYLLLIARAGRIVGQCSRAFPALLIMGCAILITFQALTHMAIVTGTFPVSGQPLPFFSKGGTSVLVMSAAMGMMLSVSKSAVRNGTQEEIRRELDSLPEEMQSENPMKLYGKKKK